MREKKGGSASLLVALIRAVWTGLKGTFRSCCEALSRSRGAAVTRYSGVCLVLGLILLPVPLACSAGGMA